MRLGFTVIAWLFFAIGSADAACPVFTSSGRPAPERHDALAAVFSGLDRCPESAPALKARLTDAGLRVRPAMVANRGRHNPAGGSFSFFETVTGAAAGVEVRDGDFFFGHFTGADGGTIVLDQAPDNGKLLVELIAWDATKGFNNFYELIGTGGGARWFYRGDSADALRDNAFLFRAPPPGTPKFGRTMRCSACHGSGGPIMKELAAPHNDWWTAARPLPFGANRPDAEVTRWLGELVETATFARSVAAGIDRLEASAGYRAAREARSLPERLRPLFCDNEINLESDGTPLDDNAEEIRIPSASLVSPLLATGDVRMSRAAYVRETAARRLRFPETERADADHAWLVPVKGHSDLLAIASLVRAGVVNDELVADVLAVDMGTPLLSTARCGLLALVPARIADLPEALRRSSLPAARELLRNIEDPARTRAAHRTAAARLLIAPGIDRLVAARRAVFDSELSRNPLGQILEPGFRVIFPVPR